MNSFLRVVILVSMVVLPLSVTAQTAQAPTASSSQSGGVRLMREWNAVVGETMSAELLPPTVSARVLAALNIAAYEAARRSEPRFPTMAGRLRGMPVMPEPDSGCTVDARIAAMAACKVIATSTLFRVALVDSLYNAQIEQLMLEGLSASDRECAERFGVRVGTAVAQWMAGDGYARMLGRISFEAPRRDGAWEPTPPFYEPPQDALWGTMRLMVLDTALVPLPGGRSSRLAPLAFSRDTSSPFMRSVREVFDTAEALRPERFQQAMYWYNLPAHAPGKGEERPRPLMRLPAPTRWIGIAGIRSDDARRSMVELLHSSMVAAVAMHETMIVTWAEKYRHFTMRPVTAVNGLIARGWSSPLPAPPTPEYPSEIAAAAGAGSAAIIATMGEGAFADSTEASLGFGGRRFASLNEAAEEAALSGLFGGVQYRTSCDAGLSIGRAIADVVVRRLIDPSPTPTERTPRNARQKPTKRR